MSKEKITSILEKNKSQMRKGFLEYCTLLIISQGQIYALNLLKELRKVKIEVVEGTLYPLLSRLKREGILSYSWQESDEGPPRKYYFLTEFGQVVLTKVDQSVQDSLKSVAKLREKWGKGVRR